MSLLRVVKVKNGDYLMDYAFYKCDKCGCEIPEQYARYDNGDIDYCYDCSFKQGLINEREYLDGGTGFCSDMFHAGIEPGTGEIKIWYGSKTAPWLKTPKQSRHTKEYEQWRKTVFERDNFTCQNCGIRGGILNAHHIKPYAKFKKLRYTLDNGITLCEQCHRKEHKKR